MPSVELSAHDPNWTNVFEREAGAIAHVLAPLEITLHHIGSTSIAGILAKPIIDILGEVTDITALDQCSKQFEKLGYEIMGAFGIEGRRYFRKDAAQGIRCFQLHVFEIPSPHIIRHLAFRDYLCAHPEQAAEYSALKARIVGANGTDWETYMDLKDPFIAKIEPLTVAWYHKKHDQHS